METIPESALDKILEKAMESSVGFVIVCIIVVIIALLPFWKWLYGVYKDWKDKRDKQREKERKEAKELQDNIKQIAKHLPELDQQVLSLSNEVSSFRDLKDEWIDTTRSLHTTVVEMKADISALANKSQHGDDELAERIKDTQEIVSEMRQTTKKIETDIGVLFEGENNEFRIYLTQLHERHITKGEPMTREIRQRLRIKFESYEKRGGNGWAKELYLDLMSLPVESYVLPNDNNNN